MEECRKQRLVLSRKFHDLSNVFIALGDELRQQIFLSILESEKVGIRVPEITAMNHLSRPAVSHHLKILKEAGLIAMHRVGTRNYYYVDANQNRLNEMKEFLDYVATLAQEANKAGYPRLKEDEAP